jgi:hypothetical protein
VKNDNYYIGIETSCIVTAKCFGLIVLRVAGVIKYAFTLSMQGGEQKPINHFTVGVPPQDIKMGLLLSLDY